jgi:C-terminal processing protease CtpA/Prc
MTVLALVGLAAVAACPAPAAEEKAEVRQEVRVEMHAAGPGQEPTVRMWVNGEEVKPGDPAPAGVGRLEAESITDPDAGMPGGEKAKARTHSRIEIKPDQPGGQPRVRMWINGKEVEPGKGIQLGEGKARIRIQTAPEAAHGQEAPNQAVLGVRITELTDGLAREVGAETGVAVTGAIPGSPAEHVGLRPGDVITAVDGKEVRSPEDLVERIGRYEPGSRIRVRWHRQRARIEATFTLAAREDFVASEGGPPEARERREREARERAEAEEREARERERIRRERDERERDERERDERARAERERAERERAEQERAEREAREAEERERAEAEETEREERPGGFLGILAAPLNDDMREISGTDKGVLINSLTDDSPAAKAGLKPGDVIVRIGDADINGVDQLLEALSDRKPGQRMPVVYYRMGKRLKTEVTLGRRPGEEGDARRPEEMPPLEDLFGREMPNLREYLERLRPQMEEWARRFRERQQREGPGVPAPEPRGMGRDFDRLMERLDRIERRLDRIEERLERAER